jgi:hypothetical protein
VPAAFDDRVGVWDGVQDDGVCGVEDPGGGFGAAHAFERLRGEDDGGAVGPDDFDHAGGPLGAALVPSPAALDLMTRRLPNGHAINLDEHVPATTIQRPVLDDAVHRPRRQQRPSLALMPGLGALLAPRPILAALWRPSRRIVLGGCDEFREDRPTRRSSCAIRSSCAATRFSSRCICSSIRNSTATTASRPWS